MKRYFVLITLLLSVKGYTQNSINYKALIKDGSGVIIANSSIEIQFSILKSDLQVNVYKETHAPTTDNNGIVIVNIGEGNVVSGNFNAIDWGEDTHFLNVQINTGSGYVDIGTTQLSAVPYAFHAKTAANINGLEAIDEGNGTGWRLVGRFSENYGAIGLGAIDLSHNSTVSTEKGAIGAYSIAMGIGTVASGDFSTALGFGAEALGNTSTAMGYRSVASGNFSLATGSFTSALGINAIAMGSGTIASSYLETVIGRYNDPYIPNNAVSWHEEDRLFVIGNGDAVTPSNAIVVLKNGNLGIGTSLPQELLHINGGRLRIGGEIIEDGGGDILAFSSSLVPMEDEGDRLGGPNRRWIDVYAANGVIQTSDRRSKTNIEALNYGLTEVLQMQPVRFNWKNKNNPDTKLGLIAQDLQGLMPEVVQTHVWEKDSASGILAKKELNRLGVYYSDLIPVLINAIKKQQDIINKQNTKIQGLRAEMIELKSMGKRIGVLEKQLGFK